MFPGAMKARPLRRWLGGVAVALAIAGCGGGTSQYEPFVPERLFAFGDESSVLTADGRKYSVNVVDGNGALDCRSQPLWVQTVASVYSFVFAECNPDAVAAPQARMRAVAGARVAELAAQIDAVVAAGGFTGNDLATVLVGANDVLELYGRFPDRPEAELIEEARARGERLADQVNRLVDLGVRVVVSTVPDMGLSPYALAQKDAYTDTDRSALISRLTAALNGRMRVRILNDGRYVGLVLADEMVQAMARAPGAFGLNNASAAVCTLALPACTSGTVVSGGSSAAYLWADDRRMAFGGQRQLGLLAESRVRNNPF